MLIVINDKTISIITNIIVLYNWKNCYLFQKVKLLIIVWMLLIIIVQNYISL